MALFYRKGAIKTRLMWIKQGIFQGDSLSPLLFCMALNPVSVKLRKTGYGYWISTGRGETAKRQHVSRYFTRMI